MKKTKAEILEMVVNEEITQLELYAHMAFNRGDRVRELECDQQKELLEGLIKKANTIYRDTK